MATQIQNFMNRFGYWNKAIANYILPNKLYREQARRIIMELNDNELDSIINRVNYYIKLRHKHNDELPIKVKDFRYPYRSKHRNSLYFFDLYRILSCFEGNLKFAFLFGDITHEPAIPSFVKSRPIASGDSNSAIMKLDALRHFRFIKDKKTFSQKKDMLVSRNWVAQEHRRLLLRKYNNHHMCNVGKINYDEREEHPEWVKQFMTIEEQLNYKFIACIEGYDVATNLKWVMSSNSLAVMPRPMFETWFMEGALIPNVHYVEILPDYSNLIEKMDYYITHPAEAEDIIANAHTHVAQFQNKRLELVTQLLAAKKYFKQTGQLTDFF